MPPARKPALLPSASSTSSALLASGPATPEPGALAAGPMAGAGADHDASPAPEPAEATGAAAGPAAPAEPLDQLLGAGREDVSLEARWEAQWEAQYAKLEAYAARFENCNVPQKWEENPQLGTWVRKQRDACKKGKLDASRQKRLEGLGLVWDLQAAEWEAQYAKLEAYAARFENCNVPQKWEENPQLGTWVNTQRKACKKGKLDASRQKRLEGLGLVWEVRSYAGWEAQYAKLEAYEARFENCNVPQKWEENPELGRWVRKQRDAYNKGKLEAWRKQKLDKLGFQRQPLKRGEAQCEAASKPSLKKFKSSSDFQGEPSRSFPGLDRSLRNFRLTGPRGEGWAEVDGQPVLGLGAGRFQFFDPDNQRVMTAEEVRRGGRWLLGEFKRRVVLGDSGTPLSKRNGVAFTIDTRSPTPAIKVLKSILDEALEQAATNDDAKHAEMILRVLTPVFEQRQREGGHGSKVGRFLEISYYNAPGRNHQDNPDVLSWLGGALVLAVDGDDAAPPLSFTRGNGEVVGDVMRTTGEIGFVGSPMLLCTASRSDGHKYGLWHHATGMVPSPTAEGADFRGTVTLIVRFDMHDVVPGLRILPCP